MNVDDAMMMLKPIIWWKRARTHAVWTVLFFEELGMFLVGADVDVRRSVTSVFSESGYYLLIKGKKRCQTNKQQHVHLDTIWNSAVSFFESMEEVLLKWYNILNYAYVWCLNLSRSCSRPVLPGSFCGFGLMQPQKHSEWDSSHNFLIFSPFSHFDSVEAGRNSSNPFPFELNLSSLTQNLNFWLCSYSRAVPASYQNLKISLQNIIFHISHLPHLYKLEPSIIFHTISTSWTLPPACLPAPVVLLWLPAYEVRLGEVNDVHQWRQLVLKESED